MLNCAARAALVAVSALGVLVYCLVRLADQSLSIQPDPYAWAPFGIFLLCIASCFVPRPLLRIIGAMLYVGLLLLAMFWETFDVLVLMIAGFILGALWWAVYWERSRGWMLTLPRRPARSPSASDPEAAAAAQQSKYIRGEIKQKY